MDFSDQGLTILDLDVKGNRFYLEQVMDNDEIARIIEDLLTQPPKASGDQVKS